MKHLFCILESKPILSIFLLLIIHERAVPTKKDNIATAELLISQSIVLSINTTSNFPRHTFLFFPSVTHLNQYHS